ncbi:MAG TPA: hypothetical protein VGK50_08485 [Coriobacteriia bacterium]|jgi:hypothetical protein
MKICEFAWRCGGLISHLSDKPVLASIYRHRYCEDDCAHCARYMMASAGPIAIPDDLLPNQHHRLPAFGLADTRDYAGAS